MSTYEISKSSLLSLKVEILKKQEEINKSKLENKSFVPASHGKKASKTPKNKGVDERGEKDYEEDPDLLRKSRQMLEAKSKLYDKLSKKQSTFEDNKHYLVNFNQKSARSSRILDECPNFDDDPDDVDKYQGNIDEDTTEPYEDDNADSDNEWTEYTDALGRTRTCLKKDLEYMKSKDKKIIGDPYQIQRESSPIREDQDNNKIQTQKEADEEKLNEENELLSSDMKRELLRQQWERDEAKLAQKDNVHYQDVLFNEARTHGVGYFAFSKDETERAKQQSELEKLRRETTEKQKEAQDLKKTRENLLKNRIRAAQNRKRARLGLPPLEESEEEPEKRDESKEIPAKVEVTEEEKERDFKRRQHVRPWDIGKEGVERPKEHYIYSQEEWVAKKREERIQEFAPPRMDNIKGSKRRNSREYTSKSNRKYRKEDNASVNPYKSVELLLTSDSDSSSNDESDDRLMQAYKETQTDNTTKKISFKVLCKTADPTSKNSSSFAPKSVEPVSIVSKNITSFAQESLEPTPVVTLISSDVSEPIVSSFAPVPIVNEVLYSPTQSYDDSSSDNEDEHSCLSKLIVQQQQGQRDSSAGEVVQESARPTEQEYAEIPPPPTFDYYGPSAGNRAMGRGKRGGANMENSIMMGLKFLREQSEKKGRLNRGNDDVC